MRVSIIIPNYNGKDLLQKNLEKVLIACAYYKNQGKAKVQVIIVDDASKDGSVEFLRNSRINITSVPIKIIEQKKNSGYSSTINNGVSYANGDIIVLLNTDIVPEKDFLLPLLSHFASDNIFAVGCMDKSVEGDKTILRGRGVGRWERGFLIHKKGGVNKQTTLWVSGGSGAFRKDIWDKLGGFDPLYNPFYWEDVDLSYRALKSGYSILFESKSVVTHRHETGAIKTHFSPVTVKVIAYRNQFIFVWKNITDLDLLLSHVLWLPYHFAKALLRFDRAFFVGFFAAFFCIPSIVKSKKIAQKLFTKKDKDVVTIYS